MPGYAELRNFFTFDLGSLPAGTDVVDATLQVFQPSYEGYDPFETYAIYDVSTPGGELVAGGSGLTDIFDDLGSGVVYGSRDVYPVRELQPALVRPEHRSPWPRSRPPRVSSSPSVALLTTIDYSQTAYWQAIFSGSGDFYPRQLVLTLSPSDFYSVTVNPGDGLSVLTGTPAGGPGEFVNAPGSGDPRLRCRWQTRRRG